MLSSRECYRLANAPFESIPYEHRIESRIYGGKSWGGQVTKSGQDGELFIAHSIWRPTLDALDRSATGMGIHIADKE